MRNVARALERMFGVLVVWRVREYQGMTDTPRGSGEPSNAQCLVRGGWIGSEPSVPIHPQQARLFSSLVAHSLSAYTSDETRYST